MSGYVTELSVADVLFGRGSGPNDHPGNIQFRDYVAARKTAYMATSHRLTKTNLAKEILNLVAANGGRFLRKVDVPPPELFPDGTMDVYEVVDDQTIMEKAKQALRQNASRAKEQHQISASSSAATTATTTTTAQELEFDLEPIPFTISGYSGPPPTSSPTPMITATNLQQQMHQTPVSANTTSNTLYDVSPYCHSIPHQQQQHQPESLSYGGRPLPNPSYSSSTRSANQVSVASSSSYASAASSTATNASVHAQAPVQLSNAISLAMYQEEQEQEEDDDDDNNNESPAILSSSSGYSPLPNQHRANSKRESLSIDDLRGFDPKQMYQRMDELSTSFSNMKSITYENMASSDTMGTIEQCFGSDMSIASSTLSIFAAHAENGNSAHAETMRGNTTTTPARHATYVRTAAASQPLGGMSSPAVAADGVTPGSEGSATVSSRQRSGRDSSNTTLRSSKASTLGGESTSSLMSFDGLFDASFKNSKSSSLGFDNMYTNVRRQVDQEVILEESSDEPFVPLGQSSMEVIKALQDSSEQLQQQQMPPLAANDQRRQYYEQQDSDEV